MAIGSRPHRHGDGTVVRVQRARGQRGFDPAPVDGQFADGTESAVRGSRRQTASPRAGSSANRPRVRSGSSGRYRAPWGSTEPAVALTDSI